ncbi:MAG TPA: M3 family oligoendopeptidase, partial [Bacteroidia bacterium]|nr:M3 family oligoendopeptidase [Bacteroidia bacterium]
RMSCDTTNKDFSDSFNYFVSEIEPKISPITNALNKKLLECKFLPDLQDPRMEIMLRNIRKQVEIFREANIPLFAELQQKEQHFATIAGAMTIDVEGKEITLQQAANYLKSNDRAIRENVYHKIVNRRLKDREALDNLYDELIALRHKIALNADFSNFRDYMFAALGRFDYTPQDCFDFHKAIAEEIVPLTNVIMKRRKDALGYEVLKPWDTEVDVSGSPALIPFNGSDDIMSKTMHCFNDIHPFLGSCIKTLQDLKHVDLESRKGKAPGGFNYPLYESGVPFIFMNSTNSLRDLVTIVHEGGHAVHSILTKDLEYVEFRSTPSEVAELASMSMELISMEHWGSYFNNSEELKRARIQHIEKMIESIPWIAAIDKFQHWVYTNPGHTAIERRDSWTKIYSEFSGNVLDWEGQENAFSFSWQKQLHLYQVPFYYIEYGMAQLGAIAIWRNYSLNPDETLEAYFNALKLGYTAPIGEIYKAAGIRFDFSRDYVKELSSFLSRELAKLA